MYSRVFEVVDDEGRVLFFLVKSARGGPLESIGSQFTANAVARHEDGEFLWAIRDTEQARLMVEWIARHARIVFEVCAADIEWTQATSDALVLASVAPLGMPRVFFALGDNGEAVTPVFDSTAAFMAWLGNSALPPPSFI